MPESDPQFSAQEEIQELERKLEEKKRELAAAGAEAPPEKQIFREIFKKHMEDISRAAHPQTNIPPAGGAAQLQPPVRQPSDDARDEAHREQIESLVEMAFSKGLVDAVEAARHLHNPHILDEFHDTLEDEYYDKIVAARHLPIK